MKEIAHIPIIALLVSIVLAACSESKSDEYSSLRVEPETLVFPAEGGQQTFKIVCNTSWTITVPEGKGIWITTTQGTGDRELGVSLPATSNGREAEYRLLIKSADNHVANLVLRQEGILLSGIILEVTNVKELVFGGYAGEIDSLQIAGNVPWKLYGPEWTQAWNGSKWVDLSPSRAMVEGGSLNSSSSNTEIIKLRVKNDNDEESMLTGKIKLLPAYDNTVDGEELDIVQLGRHHAAPNRLVALAHDITCDWKCGKDVQLVYCYLSDHFVDWEQEGANIQWGVSQPDFIYGWTGLNENTPYYLYALGMDADNNYNEYLYNSYQTKSSKNQAEAAIQSVNYDVNKGEWSWRVQPNSYCKLYSMWVTENTSFFDYTDGMLAWLLNYIMHNSIDDEDWDMYSSGGAFNRSSTNHMQIITWGAGQNGNVTSGVINRYRSIDYYEAPQRRECVYSAPIDKEAIQKSFIRIK